MARLLCSCLCPSREGLSFGWGGWIDYQLVSIPTAVLSLSCGGVTLTLS